MNPGKLGGMYKQAFDQPDYFVANCRAGLEPVLERELKDLGCEIAFVGTRMVAFYGSEEDFYRANMALRTAINVLRPIRKFRAKDYDILYFQARKAPWHKLFDVDKTIRIDVKGESPNFRNSQYTVHRIKDAIVDTFRKLTDGYRPSIEKREPDVHVVAFVHRDEVTLYLDGAGEPLFKRGYRIEHGEAPLKEDLAAGLLQLAGYKGNCDFVDPMCGSGTFLCEAYLLANRIAPNLNRSFAFQNWLDFDPEAFERARQSLIERQVDAGVAFHGFEADFSTRKVLERIVADHFGNHPSFKIHPHKFQDGDETFSRSVIVTNPPYGVRLQSSEADLNRLYADLGNFLRHRCEKCGAAVFSSNSEALNAIGMKVANKWKLYNGQIEARLVQYKL
ncbi:MAG: THUMP domain-containing protein [Verrucomicrobiota bacterium JB022]|nr:THUMP domain-containing protein [Verrucomicrobiota bacterium JB022]